MNALEVILLLFLVAVFLCWSAQKLRMPYPITLVLGGLVLGFIPSLPAPTYSPHLLLTIVLPPILYHAALLTSWREFKRNLRPIMLLAVGLVLFTTVGVTLLVHLLFPQLPWLVGALLGAIISPPDAVAATAVLKRLPVPKRVAIILEGESLVNDATALVLYKFAVAALVTGQFNATHALSQFFFAAFGGVGVGFVLARLFMMVHRKLRDPLMETMLSLTLPYTAFILAEHVNTSGVLAVVTAGIIRAWYQPQLFSPQARLQAMAVWDALVFILNCFVFILIGLYLHPIISEIGLKYSISLLGPAFLLVMAVMLIRIVWIFPATYAPRLLLPQLSRRDPPPPKGPVFIVAWCGMRGIVSLVAALALPKTTLSGAPFPFRDEILLIVFVVILATLLLPGLSLRPIIKRLKLQREGHERVEERQARQRATKQAIKFLSKRTERGDYPAPIVRAVQGEYSTRLACFDPEHHTMRPVSHNHAAPQHALQQLNRLKLKAVRAERQEIIRLRQAELISDEVMLKLLRELDYAELHYNTTYQHG